MKKLLVIYQRMTVGGSTTSLLALLESIDKSAYEIDLILSRNDGELLGSIPEGVTLLSEAMPPLTKAEKLFRSLFHKEFYRLLFYRIFKKKKRYTVIQLSAYNAVRYARKLTKEYDVAVGYLEGFSNAYLLSDHVRAKRKIAWIHTDYASSGLDARVDAPYFRKADRIVLVSDSCKESFDRCLPAFAHKSIAVENMLSRTLLQNRSVAYTVERHGSHVHFLTVCRLDIHTKGLDRLAAVAARLKKDGYTFTWTVVGDGERETFARLCEESGVSDCVIAVGGKTNPYPYFRAADCFVLPSRYEGKPMVISEAQMLSLPCIVSAYASAAEQIRDGKDGLIAENSADALYGALGSVLEDPALLTKFSDALSERSFDSAPTVQKIHSDILEQTTQVFK